MSARFAEAERALIAALRPDPPVRDDGLCAYDGCEKMRVVPKQTYATREEHEADPFCSTVCCRHYHGVEMGAEAPGELRKQRGGRKKVYDA